jgi:hypothetical protein
LTKLEKLIYDTIKDNDINSVLDAVEDMYDKIKDEKAKADEKKKAEALKEQKKYQEQLGKDAVDLYEHIALYLSKYYLDSTGEEKICEKKKYYEKHPMELVKLFETAWSSEQEPKVDKTATVGAAKPTQSAHKSVKKAESDGNQIKVYTNVDGKENSYTVDLDKWTDVLNDFFDAFGI